MSAADLDFQNANEAWAIFKASAIPADAPACQRDDMEGAFYSGVSTGLRLAVRAIEGDDTPDEVWQAIAKLNAELGAVIATRRARLDSLNGKGVAS